MVDVNDDAKDGGYRRVEVLTGPGRRRRWSDDDKAKVVAETLEPGAVVAEVARRWQICPQQVFTWRREMRAEIAAPLDFVPVVVETTASESKAAVAGAVLRVAPGTDEALLATVLRAIRTSAT
jgi:transposase